MYPKVVVLIKDPTHAISRRNALSTAITEGKKIESIELGDSQDYELGRTFELKGEVIDWTTAEPMSYATIIVNDSLYSTTSNQAGKFSLSLAPGQYLLSLSFLGYREKIVDLSIYADGAATIELEKISTELDDVIVQAERTQDLTRSQIGKIVISLKDIKRAPSFLGEVDLVKQVQSLPGVTTVGEAASGYNVRGGSVDQNLILYDGIPVFNSSHVFGFLTAFNPEAVENVSFYKGGIPSEYGGRISSVMDIQSKDGDMEKWNYNLGLGMITSNAMINGPIKENKTAIAASVRSTYSNWLVHSIRTDYADLSESKVFFYDAALKLTHIYSDKVKLSVTSYGSQDSFSLVGDTTYRWHNYQLSAKLDYQLSQKLGAEFVLGASSYGYDVVNEDYLSASELSYSINTTVAKADFHYEEGKHNLGFGWQLSHYLFQPGKLRPNSDVSSAAHVTMDRQYSIENAFYIHDELKVNEKLTIESGLRIPMFFSFGPASVFKYAEGEVKQTSNVIDTLEYKGGSLIKSYFGLEPRLSLNWLMAPEASLKLGYNRMFQYLHLVTNTTAVTPVDIWQPSGYYFKPQRADQISAGYFQNFKNKAFGFSTEVFYKRINNLIDFKEGAKLILNSHLETELLQGKGISYGFEYSFFKNEGRLTGSVNYTYSRAFRQIAGATQSESINRGKRYPASFDQPHIINLSWKYNISKRHFFTGNFTFHSGRPVTIPLSVFAYEEGSITYFSGRNQYRIPDYHRLDLALVIEGNHNTKRKAKGTWVFSVYNVYSRENPYTMFFKNSNRGVPSPYQLSIVGTLLPSISYNLKF